MRRRLPALALSALLAGCQLAGFGAAPQDSAPQTALLEDGEQPAGRETVIGGPETGEAESGAETGREALPDPVPAPPAMLEALPPPPEPPMLAQQRAACRNEGGLLMPRGPGLYACVRQTRDAGRRCDESSDCQGACLARSATCAPLTPLFGCHEVFTSRDRRETLCLD